MTDLDGWVTRFANGEARALARGLTWLEAGDPRGWRVGVLAIDPSSPVSGGVLLGDRIRLTRWAKDDGVFVRSMASRGRTGGLAPTVLDALALMTAFGFDLLLLETVGVGQAEVDVAAVVDTTVVALAPGLGDDVQAAKAGLMEIADVYALTEADLPGAVRLAADVRESLDLRAAAAGRAAAGSSEASSWRLPVVALAVARGATERPEGFAADGGVGALLAALDAHAAHLEGVGAARRRGGAHGAWRTAVNSRSMHMGMAWHTNPPTTRTARLAA